MQGRVDSGNLREDVDAVLFIADHSTYPTNLAFDAAQSLHEGVLVGCISVVNVRIGSGGVVFHTSIIPLRGMVSSTHLGYALEE